MARGLFKGGDVYRLKSLFFDRKGVIDRVGRASARALSRFGAYVRRTARTSIRNRRRVSRPGEPPSSHTGLLREFLYFSYEPFRQSVVIGPAKLNMVFFDKAARPVAGTVPEVLEYGGDLWVHEVFFHGQWWRADLRSRRRMSGRPQRRRRVAVAARPYMGPAFEENLPHADRLWADSVAA